MNTLSRKSKDFQERINYKFEEQIKNLDKNNKDQIETIKNLENESQKLFDEYEKEIAEIKEKYIKKNEELIAKRKEEIEKLNVLNKKQVNFWFKVLVNDKITNEIITQKDYDVLKFLTNIRLEYIDKEFKNFKLIFEFEKNEYFSNEFLEKQYFFSEDKLISQIISTEIKWKENKNYSQKKIKKIYKNKKTGKTKEIELNSPSPTFFNFFCNITIPNKKQIASLSFKEEKELGEILDKEYEIAEEIKNELLPHASEYYVGIKQDIEEYSHYLEKNFNDFDM